MSKDSVTETPLSARSRRNRMIAMVAGVITVVAVVLDFAGDFLGLPWHWMRPAAELLPLAELVGLAILERHQLFEPVHENVGAIRTRMEELHAMMPESARTSGQVTAWTSTPEVFRTMTRVAGEALARDQLAPQIFRGGRLAGRFARSGIQLPAVGSALKQHSDNDPYCGDNRCEGDGFIQEKSALGIADFERAFDSYGYESRHGQEFENDLRDFERSHNPASSLGQTVPAIFE